MRHILCQRCAAGSPGGKRRILEETTFEPAEYERGIWGRILAPSPRQRTVTVNDVPFVKPLEYWNCDRCDGRIYPGEQVYCRTVWIAGHPEPPPWEQEYLAS